MAAPPICLPRLTPLPTSYGVPVSAAPLRAVAPIRSARNGDGGAPNGASGAEGAEGKGEEGAEKGEEANGGTVRLLRFTDRTLVLVQQRPRRGVGCLIQATPSTAPHILPTFDPDAPSPSLPSSSSSSSSSSSASPSSSPADLDAADAPHLSPLFGAPTSSSQETLLNVYAAAITQLLVQRGETGSVVCGLSLVGGGEEEGEEGEGERGRLRETLRAVEGLL